MKILLTGSTGYIGRRLLPVLLDAGHHVVCFVRHYRKFDWEAFPQGKFQNIEVIEGDLLDSKSLGNIPTDIDLAFYLVHSMSSTDEDFEHAEIISATNFARGLEITTARQIIFLSG